MSETNEKSSLPEGWKWVTIDSAVDFVIGGDWGKDENFDDPNFGFAYCIRGSEIRNWNTEKGRTASLRKIKLNNIEKRKLQVGDILVEISGGGPDQPVGRTVLIDKTVLSYQPEIPKICTNFLRMIRLKENVYPSFLNYYLQFFYRSGEIVNYQAGSNNLRNLKFPDYLKIEFPLPPKPIQQAIVSKIEELFSELDKSIETLRLAQQQLKTYRQAVLNELVTKNDLKTIESIIDKLDQGWSPKCENEPSIDKNEWAVIKTSAVQHGSFLEFENKRLPKDLKPREQHELKAGDILITRAGPRVRVGVCCIIKQTRPKLINCDKVYRIKLNKKYVLPEYFEMIMNTPHYLDEIEKMKTGISDSGLNLTQKLFLQINITVPSIEKQTELIQEIESRFSVADKMEESITQSLQQAETLRQSVLKKAFEGKLIVEKKPAIYKPRNEYFYQAQFLGLVIRASKKKEIAHGEMTIAKYGYLIDKVYGIPSYYNYKRWHLGPYPPEMKKAINNRSFFKKQNGNIEVADEETLFKYNNHYQKEIESAVDDLAVIFSKYSTKERAHKTELLATVCKVVEDIQTLNLQAIRASMKDWKIELDNSPFQNKAEKFTEAETAKCSTFLKEKGWDKKLIKADTI